MSIPMTCACGNNLILKDEFAGRKVKCPSCGQHLVVPESETEDEVFEGALVDEGDDTDDLLRSDGNRLASAGRTAMQKAQGRTKASSGAGGMALVGGLVLLLVAGIGAAVWTFQPAAGHPDVAAVVDQPSDAVSDPIQAAGNPSPLLAEAQESAEQPAAPAVPRDIAFRVKLAYEAAQVRIDAQKRKEPLKQIGLAMHRFHDTFRHFPAVDSRGTPGAFMGLSWRVHLLPFLDQTALYNEFRQDEPWDSPHNLTLVKKMPAIFGKNPEGKTKVHVFTGENLPFQSGQGIQFRQITDGTSNTLMAAECSEDTAEIWSKPVGLPFDPQKPAQALGKVGDTFLALLMDGSVRTLPVNFPDLPYLLQYKDGHIVNFPAAEGSNVTAISPLQPGPLPPLAPGPTEVDLQYLPDSAAMAVIVQPRRIIEHELVQKLIGMAKQRNQPTAMFVESLFPGPVLAWLGLPVDTVDEVRLVTGERFLPLPPARAPDWTDFGALIRSAVPVRVERMVDTFSRSVQQLDFREKDDACFVVNSETGIVLGFRGDREVFYGNEATILTMLGATGGSSGRTHLHQLLKDAGPGPLAVAATLSAAWAGKPLQERDKWNPVVREHLADVAECRGVSLGMNLDGPQLVRLSVEFANSEVGNRIASEVEPRLATAREQVTQANTGMGPLADLTPMLAEVLAVTRIATAGNAFTVTVNRPDHFADLPAILEPQLTQYRKADERNVRRNALKVLGLAMHNYRMTFNRFPTLDGPGYPEGKQGLSWRVYLLPYLNQYTLYKEFHLDEPWDSPHNLQFVKRMPAVFGDDPEGKTRLHVLTGGGAPFQNGVGRSLGEITNGVSSTIQIVEAGKDTADIWTKPGGLQFDPASPLKCLGTADPDEKGFSIVMMDGSVQPLAADVDPTEFCRMVQYARGEGLANASKGGGLWRLEGLPAPLAHFGFNGSMANAGTDNARWDLRNTGFRDNALYINGQYEHGRGSAAYRAVCQNPKLNYNAFSVVMRFKAEDFGPDSSSPSATQKINLITGGTYSRWFGMHRSPAGNLVVTLNNNPDFSHEFKGFPLKKEEWTTVACSVDLVNWKIIAARNGKPAEQVAIPKSFRFAVVGSDREAVDKVWSFTRYSNGSTFFGLVDELAIFDRALTADEVTKVISTAAASGTTGIPATGSGQQSLAANPGPTERKEPAGPAADAAVALKRLGANLFFNEAGEVFSVNFQPSKITDAELARLKDLKTIEVLVFAGNNVTDAGLIHFKDLPRLKRILLGCNGVTDNGLEQLKALQSLEDLTLSGPGITDAGMTHLKGLPQLKSLGLVGTRVTDSGLREVGQISSLQSLSLMGQFTDGGVAHLRELKQLKMLFAPGVNLTDTGLASLKDLANLQSLIIGGSKVTDSGLTSLAGLTTLEMLDLSRTAITDAGLVHLKPLKTLKNLNLSGSKVTEKGLDVLRELPALLQVNLQGISVSAAAVTAFEGSAPNRRVLGLSNPAQKRTEVPTAPLQNPPIKAAEWKGWPKDVPPPAIAPFNAELAKQHQEAWAKHLGVPVEFTNSVGIQFRLIPPGEFLMGSTDEEVEAALTNVGDEKHWQACIKTEAPRHKVILTQAVYIGIHEVRQDQYEKVMEKNPSFFASTGPGKESVAGVDTSRFPVENVNWDEIAAFCNKLSALETFRPGMREVWSNPEAIATPSGYRLPTAAEWEFACRAGTTTKYWSGDNAEDLAKVGWSRANSEGRLHAAGELLANPFGLFDMHGNVWERVLDRWEPSLYQQFLQHPGIDPSRPSFGRLRGATLGGSYDFDALLSRAAMRTPLDPDAQFGNNGFRVAVPVDAVKAWLSHPVQSRLPVEAEADGQPMTLKMSTTGIACVAFSRDGTRLASSDGNGTVNVWDSVSGQELLTLKGHTSWVLGVAFSPDGRRLASAGVDRIVKVWDTSNGQETLTFKGHHGPVNSVAFSPDGARLATSSGDRTIKVWDATSGEELRTFNGQTTWFWCVAFSADGTRLASASKDQTVKVWNATNGQEILALKGHTADIRGVAFSPDGKWLASASHDRTVKVWDAANGQLARTLEGHSSGVLSVAYSPDGKRLASAGSDETVKLWDATSGQEILTLTGHCDQVVSVAFRADGKRLASASYDQSVKVWDVSPQSSLFAAETLPHATVRHKVLHSEAADAADAAKTARPLTNGDFTAGLQGWQIEGGATDFVTFVQGTVTALTTHGRNREADTGRLYQCFQIPSDATELQFSAHGGANSQKTYVALRQGSSLLQRVAGRNDNTPFLVRWNVVPLRGKVVTLEIVDDSAFAWGFIGVQGFSLLREREPVARGMESNGDTHRSQKKYPEAIAAYRAVIEREPHNAAILNRLAWLLAITPATTQQATEALKLAQRACLLEPSNLSFRNTLGAAECRTGDFTEALSSLVSVTSSPPQNFGWGAHNYFFQSLCYEKYGDRPSAQSAYDAGLELLKNMQGDTFSRHEAQLLQKEVAALAVLAEEPDPLTLRGHASHVTSVVFSPDGKRLASVGADQMVKVWDVGTGRELLTIKEYVRSVAFSPDGQRLASGASDGAVKLWDATTGLESRVLVGTGSTAFGVAFTPDGKRLASGRGDGSLQIWDTTSGQATVSFKAHPQMVHGVAFSPDGKRLATAGGSDKTVKVWDTATGRELQTLEGQTVELHGVAYSPDGKWLAASSINGTVKVWDAMTGRPTLTLNGHNGSVTCVAFTSDSKRLASGGYDSMVKLWNPTNGQRLHTLSDHSQPVLCIAVSPDGTHLASGSSDHTVKVWDISMRADGVSRTEETTRTWKGWPKDSPQPANAPFDAAQAKRHQDAWAEHLGLPVEYTNSIGMKFRLIPPGEFLMGTTPEKSSTTLKLFPTSLSRQTAILSQTPQHRVILSEPFYLGVHEVTQGEFKTVAAKAPSYFCATGGGRAAVNGIDTTRHPVDSVSWHDAAEFCAKLSERERLKPFDFRSRMVASEKPHPGYRLPTEAEWEQACRAGTTMAYWIGDADEELNQAAWFRNNSGGRTHAAGELKANPFGLHDIHGNVWEWVLDAWDPGDYARLGMEPALDPMGPVPANALRGLRGGSWAGDGFFCGASYRHSDVWPLRHRNAGFRVALPADAVKAAVGAPKK